MKLSFIRQPAFTLTTATLSASLVVALAAAGDKIPVVSTSQSPKVGSVRLVVGSTEPKRVAVFEGNGQLPDDLISRLPGLKARSKVEAGSNNGQLSKGRAPLNPETSDENDDPPIVLVPVISVEPSGKVSSVSPEVKISPLPEVIPTDPHLPSEVETDRGVPVARPAVMASSAKKPGSSVALVALPVEGGELEDSDEPSPVEPPSGEELSEEMFAGEPSADSETVTEVPRVKKLAVRIQPTAPTVRNWQSSVPSGSGGALARVIVVPPTTTPVVEPYQMDREQGSGNGSEFLGLSYNSNKSEQNSGGTSSSTPETSVAAESSRRKREPVPAAETFEEDSLNGGFVNLRPIGDESGVESVSTFPLLGHIPTLSGSGDMVRHPATVEDGEVILDGELTPIAEEMPTINECCRGCPQRTYVVAEGLMFRREGEQTQLTSGFKLDGFGFKEGMRFTLGRRNDCLTGWEATYSGVEPWFAYQSATSADGNLQAAFRPGRGFNHGNLDTFYGANYQEQLYRSELHNIELNRTHWGWDVLAHSIGLRYLILNEDMRFTSLKGSDRADLEIETNNHLIGPQIGSEFFYDLGGKLCFSSRFRAGAFANVNDGAVQYTSENSPLSSFVNTDQNVGFAALGDLQFNAFYKLGPRTRLRAGYEMWYAWGLATAKGNLGPAVGPSMGANMDDTSDVLFHGLSFGFEMVR